MEIFFAAAIPTVLILAVMLKARKHFDGRLNTMEARLLSIKTDMRRLRGGTVVGAEEQQNAEVQKDTQRA